MGREGRSDGWVGGGGGVCRLCGCVGGWLRRGEVRWAGEWVDERVRRVIRGKLKSHALHLRVEVRGGGGQVDTGRGRVEALSIF